MTTYSTWEYYSGEYGGQLPQAEYNRRAPDAKYEIDRLTMGNAATAPDTMADRLARCECKMVDVMAASADLGLTAGVSSVNNDGFSVSFEAGASAAYRREVENIARALLTQPVNLLFSGAVVKNVCDF